LFIDKQNSKTSAASISASPTKIGKSSTPLRRDHHLWPHLRAGHPPTTRCPKHPT